MSEKTTIVDAISKVLRASTTPLAPREVFDAIVRENLYTFRAINPLHVLTTQLRRHTKNLDFPSAVAVKYFSVDADGRFSLLERAVRVAPSMYRIQRPNGRGGGREVLVSVPADDDEIDVQVSTVSHTEIQYRLLDLGAQMGLSVWAPRSDRGKEWDGRRVRDVGSLLAELPVHFDAATMSTIENIDVLWLERKTIVAGFEVEHTTSIFSGLLRMSDLITMQPNTDIRFYLVAPDLRAGKFEKELLRPTFSSLRKPLHTLCRFLPYTLLLARLEEARHLVRHLKPQFLDDIAEPRANSDVRTDVRPMANETETFPGVALAVIAATECRGQTRS